MRVKLSLQKTNANLLMFIFVGSLILGYFFKGIPRYGEIVTGAFACVGFILCIVSKKIRKEDFWKFAFALLLLFHSQSTEGLRYFLTFISMITWCKFNYSNIIKPIKFIVDFGIITTVMQVVSRNGRVIGFTTSPTQFACLMLVCQTFLIIYFYNEVLILGNLSRGNKIVVLQIFGCLFSIFFTSTRTILAASVIEIIYLFILFYIEKSRVNKSQRMILLLVLAIIIGVIFLLFSNSIIEIYYATTNRSTKSLTDSGRTRFVLISYILSDIQNNPFTLLFGNGGGYVENLIGIKSGTSGYLPVHQDFVLILAEYGIVGILAIFFIFLKKHRAKFVFLFVFAACSFHNIVLNSRAMLLMALILTQIEYCGYCITPNSRGKSHEKNFVYSQHSSTTN